MGIEFRDLIVSELAFWAGDLHCKLVFAAIGGGMLSRVFVYNFGFWVCRFQVGGWRGCLGKVLRLESLGDLATFLDFRGSWC